MLLAVSTLNNLIMDIIENIVNYFSSDTKQPEAKAPAGTCPSCWGYQKYDGKILELFKDKQIDVNNHKDSYSFIQKFVVKHIDGIILKEGEVRECPTCGEKQT